MTKGATGVNTGTPERIERAKRLREGGLTYKEIADLMGVMQTTASKWVNK